MDVKNDNFDWTIYSGKTPSFGTGPSVDHTRNTASGHYIYFESSAPRVPGDIAFLQSIPIQWSNSNQMCLQFWYGNMIHIEYYLF